MLGGETGRSCPSPVSPELTGNGRSWEPRRRTQTKSMRVIAQSQVGQVVVAGIVVIWGIPSFSGNVALSKELAQGTKVCRVSCV